MITKPLNRRADFRIGDILAMLTIDRKLADQRQVKIRKKFTQESTLSPGKKQRLSSRGPDVHSKLGDHEATQGAICSPKKNRRLSHMRPSDSEQGADHRLPKEEEVIESEICWQW